MTPGAGGNNFNYFFETVPTRIITTKIEKSFLFLVRGRGPISWTGPISAASPAPTFMWHWFRTSNQDIINDCCSFYNFKLPSERIHNRKTRFDSTFVKCLWSSYCMWNVCLLHYSFCFHLLYLVYSLASCIVFYCYRLWWIKMNTLQNL